ncbi:MAG: energy-coupled thiamine transporter ThiT [Clostridia bacterium]|nr:energy-coupled thiamine transporter ThiT [Clostridia bacterium]
MNTNRKTNVQRLAVSAVMIALATALSLIKIWKMPFGGSVTLVSMLPIAVVSIAYGLKWGLASSFVEAVIQLIFGIAMDGIFAWGLTPMSLIGVIVLDYLLAYTVVGFAGILRNKGYLGICIGTGFAILLRFCSHLVSGAVIFANFEQFVAFGTEWIGRPWFYSVCYNGAYMLPEIIITMIGAAVIFRLPQMRKLMSGEKA